MYVIFPADELVYLSYGRLIYVPTNPQEEEEGEEETEEDRRSTSTATFLQQQPPTNNNRPSSIATSSSPDRSLTLPSDWELGPAKKSAILLEAPPSTPVRPQRTKKLHNSFLQVPDKVQENKRLSYSDFLPVHRSLKKPANSTTPPGRATTNFDELFKNSNNEQSVNDLRLQRPQSSTPEKSPTKKKAFFGTSPKPEQRIKRTDDFGFKTTTMATSEPLSALKDLTHPNYNEVLKGHNGVTFKLIKTVSDFTQQLSQMYEQHADEIQHLVANYRKRNAELRKERPSCPSSIFHTWETLLQEVEIDSQALGDIASIMGRQVSRPLLEKSFYRKIQSRKVFTHRESYETIISKTEEKLTKCRQEYKAAYLSYLTNPTTETLSAYFNTHNAYVQQLHATNGMLDEYSRETLPQLLQELEEIYADLCATLGESVVQGAEVISARAMEQHRRYEALVQQTKTLSSSSDLVHFARALPVPQGRPPTMKRIFVPPQPPPPHENEGEDGPSLQNENIPPPLKDELVIDRLSALQVKPSHDALKKEAADLEAQIRQIQDSLETLARLQLRSVEAQLFNKANEIQEDISMKRFDLQVAQIHLAAIIAQKELFSNKLDTSDPGRERKMSNASQGSMKTKWLKAFKSLKTPPPETEKKNGAAATKELLKGDPDAHNFQEYTYKKITPCDVCSQVLRGHTRQGLKCRICKMNVHVDCQEKASKCQAKARLLRRQKSTSEIETRVPEPTVEEESYDYDERYSRMPMKTMNRQFSLLEGSRSPIVTIDRRSAQGTGTSESSMRRRIFAGMKSLTGFGSRSRQGSPGHRSISLPEKRKSTDASGTRPFGQPLMLGPQIENGDGLGDLGPPTPPSPSPSKGKFPPIPKKGAKPKK